MTLLTFMSCGIAFWSRYGFRHYRMEITSGYFPLMFKREFHEQNSNRESSIQNLLNELQDVSPGLLSMEATDVVIDRLEACWELLTGSDQTSMQPSKLSRAENLRWDPPILSFEIERHGATVLGSPRAELHRWRIDLERGTADCQTGRYRKLHPTSPKLDVTPIVASVCEAIQ